MGKILGYSTEELKSLSPEGVAGLIYNEDRTVFFKRLESRSHGEIANSSLEFRAVRKNGSIIWLEAFASLIEYMGQPAVQGMFLDIDERKKAGEILRESEQRYRELANSLPDIVFESDTTGKVVFVNDRAIEISGYSHEKFEKGANILQFLVPEDRERATKSIQRLLAGGGYVPDEYTFMRKNGTTFPALITATPSISKNKMTGLRGLVVDITERKKAEQALEGSEEKYRKLFEESMDAILVADIETGIIVDCNPAASKLVDRQKSELVGQHQSIIFPQEQIEGEFTRSFKKHLKDPTKTLETQISRKTGEIRDVAVKATIFELKGKKLMQGTFRDITERKQSEQNLREAEKRYHALFYDAPSGALVIDPQTAKPVEFNDVAHTQLGYSKEEFSELSISDFEAKETAEVINTRISKMLTEGGDEFETKHRTKTGETRNVLVTTRAVEIAGKPFLYCVFHDITEIRKVQDALMKSETQYRQLVNVAQEGIWALDNNYQTVFVNPQMAEMMGYAESEMVGKNLFEILDKKCIEQAKQFLGCFKQGAKGHFDCEFGRKNGSHMYVSITVSVIRDDEGKPSGALMMVSDITDRKILEAKVNNYSKHLKSMVELRTAQLKDANERLVKSERLAAIGELAGMVGHEA